MNPDFFWSFFSSLLTTPLKIVYLLVLVRQFRFSPRVSKTLIAIFALVIIGSEIGVGFAFRSSLETAKIGIVWIDGISFPLLILLLCPWQNGRNLFILATIYSFYSLCAALVSLLPLDYGLLRLLVKLSCNVLFLCFLHRYFRPTFQNVLGLRRRIWYQLSLVPLLFCGGFGVVLLRQVFLPKTSWFDPALAALSFVVITTYTVFYYMFHQMNKQHMTSRDNTLLTAQIHALQRQQESEDRYHAHQDALNQRVTSFLQSAREDLVRGDTTDFMKLIEDLGGALSTAPKTMVRRFTGDALIDAVLSDYEARAGEQKSILNIQLELPAFLGIGISALAVVLSNALENAVTACSEISEGQPREILLQGGPRQEAFFLTVSNTCGRLPEFDPATGLPIARREGHGYGTRSIAAFAAQYQGHVQYDVHNGQFTLRMLVYPPK